MQRSEPSPEERRHINKYDKSQVIVKSLPIHTRSVKGRAHQYSSTALFLSVAKDLINFKKMEMSLLAVSSNLPHCVYLYSSEPASPDL